MGAYDDARGADHRPRRGPLRLGRARQPLPRRALGAVLRQRRPRAHGARRGRGAAGRGARLLHDLELRAPARDRAGRADRLAGARRPEPRLLHLRRLGGGRVGDQARARLPPADRQPAARPSSSPARSPTTAPRSGALAATGHPGAAAASSSRSCPAATRCRTPNSYRWPADRDPLWAADQIEEKILYEHPETVAAVILEPLQNAGGCIPPQDGYFQRVREICDRYDVLLISDEVICAWGRLGHWFGCERYGYQPDIDHRSPRRSPRPTCRWAALIASRPGRRAVHAGQASRSPTASRSPATRSRRRSRWPTSTSSSARTSAATCGARRASSAAMLESLRDIPIVGDVRGDGFFHAIELVKDQETKEGFTDEESEWLLRGFLSGELFRRGLICRADDRGDPVIQLAPTADLRHRAVRGDRERAAPGADRGLGADQRRSSSTPIAAGPTRWPRRCSPSAAWSPIAASSWSPASRRRRAADPLGPHLRARGPDPVALGRRAAADDRDPARAAPARQRRFVALLAEHDVAGPRPGHGLRATSGCRRRSSTRPTSGGMPLFEVPYEMPFIAITERAFARLVNEQYAVLRARHPGARAPRAAGDRGPRAGGRPGLDRVGGRRLGDRPGRRRA